MKEIEVTKYEADDGKVFDVRSDALFHDAALKLTKMCQAQGYTTMETTAMVGFILGNWDSVRETLDTLYEDGAVECPDHMRTGR